MFQIPTTGTTLNRARELGAPLFDVPEVLWRDRRGSTHTRLDCSAGRGRKRAFDPRAPMPARWAVSVCESCEDWQGDRRWYVTLQCSRMLGHYLDEVDLARRALRKRAFSRYGRDFVARLVLAAWTSTMDIEAMVAGLARTPQTAAFAVWLVEQRPTWLAEVDALRAEFVRRYPATDRLTGQRQVVWLTPSLLAADVQVGYLHEMRCHLLADGVLTFTASPGKTMRALVSVPDELVARMSDVQTQALLLGPHLPTDGPQTWKVFHGLLAERMSIPDALEAARGITA